jgi:predicted thioesterase
MKTRPPFGLVGELKLTVGSEHVIDFASDGMPVVFSTPKMIGLIERVARESLYPFLEANERTVGVEVDIKHLAPTPLGASVTILTRLIGVEGVFLDFTTEVRDQHELIARGLHKRAVIRVESFARRVARKSAAVR